MDVKKNSVAMELKSDNQSTEYKTGLFRKSKKRKFEDEDSDSEQRRLVANLQERTRMQKINSALEDLKQCLPEQFHLHHRRMSKIRALRCAMMYIRNLSQLIQDDNMRRQEQYMQAMNYMRSMCDPRFTTRPTEAADPLDQTQSTVIPYYPYLGPLCANSVPSMYQTPVQNHPAQNYQPRPLDFSITVQNKTSTQTVTSPDTDNGVDYLLAGMAETPMKPKEHILPRPRRYTAAATPLRSKMLNTKSKPITSPLVGFRNDNELNISFLSANSDHTHDDQDEIPRPSSTLSDIVAGTC